MQKTVIALLMAMHLVLTGCGNTQNTPDTTSQLQAYSSAEVAEHTTKSDCWIIIEGNAYDVTDYIPRHPGRDRIVDGCGTDATALFTGTSPLGRVHSALARQLLSTYIIGTVE